MQPQTRYNARPPNPALHRTRGEVCRVILTPPARTGQLWRQVLR